MDLLIVNKPEDLIKVYDVIRPNERKSLLIKYKIYQQQTHSIFLLLCVFNIYRFGAFINAEQVIS